MSKIGIFHVSLELWGIVICLLSAVCVFFARRLNRQSYLTVIVIQVESALLLVSDCLAWIFRGRPGPSTYYMVRISNFLTYFLPIV